MTDIRDGVGPIVVEPRQYADESSYLLAKMGLELQRLGAAGGLPIDVVAGDRLGNYLPPCPVGVAPAAGDVFALAVRGPAR